MPDDVPEPEVAWSEEDPPTEAAETAHDDIMKRLLDYQRSLREGASPEEAAEAMKRGISDPSLLEASSAAESLAQLLSTEVAPDEGPEVQAEAEAEPGLEAEVAPEIETPEIEALPEIEEPDEPDVETAVEAFEPAVLSPPEVAPGDAVEATPEPLPEPAAEFSTAEDDQALPTGSRSVLAARVGSLEGKLDDLGAKIAELRRSFQDMAIAADERLASMAEEVERARREQEKE